MDTGPSNARKGSAATPRSHVTRPWLITTGQIFTPNLEGKEHRSDSSDVCCAPCEPLIKPKRKSHDCDGDVSAKSEVDEGKF